MSELRPILIEAQCCKVFFRTIHKRILLKTLSYRRYGKNGAGGRKFNLLFVHAAAPGAKCVFTLKIANTLIKTTSRDDRPSIST